MSSGIKKLAREIDKLVDSRFERYGKDYITRKGYRRTKMPFSIIRKYIEGRNLVIYYASGRYKKVYVADDFLCVLKIAPPEILDNSDEVYARLPKEVRDERMAKIFWRTKYCQFQEMGREVYAPDYVIKVFRSIQNQYGLLDLATRKNLRFFKDKWKAVDGSVSITRSDGSKDRLSG